MEDPALLARIDERQKALDEKFDIHQETLNEKLDAILKQTTKTNGRVTALEAIKNRIYGGLALIGFVVTLVEMYLHK